MFYFLYFLLNIFSAVIVEFMTVFFVKAPFSFWVFLSQQLSVKRLVSHQMFVSYCFTEQSFLPGNDLLLLFSGMRSISSLLNNPEGGKRKTSVCAAISREHISVSLGLTVADKRGMINTHTHTHTIETCWWQQSIVGGTTDVWVCTDNQPSNQIL